MNRVSNGRRRLNHAVSLGVSPNGSWCSAWLGKPVLYQLSYAREARILAAYRESPSAADATSTPTRVPSDASLPQVGGTECRLLSAAHPSSPRRSEARWSRAS